MKLYQYQIIKSKLLENNQNFLNKTFYNFNMIDE